MTALRSSGRLTSRQVLGAGLFLAALALAVFAQHVVKGGFYFDDWRGADAYAQSPGILGAQETFQAVDLNARPLYAVTWATVQDLLGLDPTPHLALSIAVAVLFAVSLFVFLREAGLPVGHAICPAALTLLFPWADSLRLWPATAHLNLSLCFLVLGATATLRALRLEVRRSLPWHLAGGLGYLLAILHYEQVVPLVPLMLGLYLRQASRRVAFARAAVDLVLTLSGALLVLGTTNSPAGEGGLRGSFDHGLKIAGQSFELLGRAVVPSDRLWWLGLILATGVALAAALATALLPAEDPFRPTLRRWLGIGGLAVLAVAAGYLTLVPATGWYVPLQPGQGTRTNAAAMVGWVMLVYALMVLAATLAARLYRERRQAVLAGCLTVALLLVAFNWINRTADDGRAWDEATSIQEDVLGLVQEGIRHPPANSTVFLFSAPRATTTEVPVFLEPVDYAAALRIRLKSPTMWGAPIHGETQVGCGDLGPQTHGGWIATTQGRYGASYFADFAARRVHPVPSREACERLLPGLRPGPIALSG
jgi:hypothetical protein